MRRLSVPSTTDQKPFQNHPPKSSQSNAIQKRSKPSNSVHYLPNTQHCPTTDNKTVNSNSVQYYPTPSIHFYPKPFKIMQHRTYAIQQHQKPSKTVHEERPNSPSKIQKHPKLSTLLTTIQQLSSPFNNIQKRHWNPIQNRPIFFSNVQHHLTLSKLSNNFSYSLIIHEGNIKKFNV